MYWSYHWAKHGTEAYVIRMGVFVLFASFFSAFFPVTFLITVTFPFTLLSFPFYAYIWELSRVDFLGIRFFPIGLAYPLPMGLGHTFPLFLYINIVGAVLGYGASRIRRIREWVTIKTWSLLGFILGIVFVGVGYWLASMPLTTKSSEALYGFGRGLYVFDGFALFFFGIIVLTISIGKILWLKILESPMNPPSFEYKHQPRRSKH